MIGMDNQSLALPINLGGVWSGDQNPRLILQSETRAEIEPVGSQLIFCTRIGDPVASIVKSSR